MIRITINDVENNLFKIENTDNKNKLKNNFFINVIDTIKNNKIFFMSFY